MCWRLADQVWKEPFCYRMCDPTLTLQCCGHTGYQYPGRLGGLKHCTVRGLAKRRVRLSSLGASMFCVRGTVYLGALLQPLHHSVPCRATALCIVAPLAVHSMLHFGCIDAPNVAHCIVGSGASVRFVAQSVWHSSCISHSSVVQFRGFSFVQGVGFKV